MEQEILINGFAYYDVNNNMRFEPPVYVQRYSAVIEILSDEKWRKSMKKVVEFGCSDLKFFMFLKPLKFVEHIVEIDIDKELLESNVHKLEPILVDRLIKRENPLKVELYAGSIDAEHNCLNNVDAVIGIEIIEHLYPNTLEDLPFNLFNNIKPKLIILTTPNYEFNVNFEMEKFRHADHKFEWTREEFHDWGDNLCIRYPDYEVKYYGIGPGVNGGKFPNVGCVSQMAVFKRKVFDDTDDQHAIMNDTNYKLLETFNYPFNIDDRSDDDKIIDEIKYHLRRFSTMSENYMDYETNTYKIPLPDLYPFMDSHFKEIEQMSEFLVKHDYKVLDNEIIIPNDDEDTCDYNYDQADDYYYPPDDETTCTVIKTDENTEEN